MRVGCAVARIGSVSVHIGPTNVRIVEGLGIAKGTVKSSIDSSGVDTIKKVLMWQRAS